MHNNIFIYIACLAYLTLSPAKAIYVGESLNSTADTTSPAAVNAQEVPEDPFESFNRGIFEFNRGIDTVLFRPLAELYRAGVPTVFRDGIHNAVTNLNAPLIFVNDVLQLEGERSMETFARFLINSTIGIGGLFDVATELGIEYHSEDFGKTLASAGVEGGPYLMLPILGLSNPRDLVGRVVDVFIDPFNIIMYRNDLDSVAYIRTGIDLLDRRTDSIPFTDRIEKTLDPYAQYRSLYIQNRDYNLKNDPTDGDPDV